MKISQMLRYFSTSRTTRTLTTSSNRRSSTRPSFDSSNWRISGVTSKLRPVISGTTADMDIPRKNWSSFPGSPGQTDIHYCELDTRQPGNPGTRSEDLLAIGRRRDVELVAVLRDGAAGDVDALVVQDLHDLRIRQRLPRILRLDEALDLLLHREGGN